MNRLLLLIVAGLIVLPSLAQKKRPLQYSKLFDSYYRKGPWKFALEPGPTYLWGDVTKNRLSYNFGVSASTKINAGLDLVFGSRFANLSANDGTQSTNAALYQFNGMGRLFLRYDRVRTNIDRRKKPKFWHFYVTSGLNLALHRASASSGGSVSGYKFNVPIGIGAPLKIGHRVKLVPEILFYYNLNDKTDVLSFTEPNDRFLLASIGIEFSPFTPRKKLKKVKVEEGEEGSSDGTPDSSDSQSDDSFDDTSAPDENSTPPSPPSNNEN